MPAERVAFAAHVYASGAGFLVQALQADLYISASRYLTIAASTYYAKNLASSQIRGYRYGYRRYLQTPVSSTIYPIFP